MAELKTRKTVARGNAFLDLGVLERLIMESVAQPNATGKGR